MRRGFSGGSTTCHRTFGEVSRCSASARGLLGESIAKIDPCESEAQSEKDLTLGVFFLSKNEWLASTNDLASADLALVALKLEGNLLGGLGLLSEDGLGLSTETGLLGVVASLTLSSGGVLSLLVLGDLVRLMLAALNAVCVFRFRSVHL